MVVISGLTVLERVPVTVPTLLSITSDDGIPPPSIHQSETVSPTMMVLGDAVSEAIVGAFGCTVTVTCLVAVHAVFDAVSV